MANPHVERHLAAILAADVAGYSRLMGVDEEGTHAALKIYRREIIDPKITEHRGRIVRIIGDGLLVEFASVIAAVRWAVDVQRAMGERNAGLPQEKRIEFRMGINAGDIIVDGTDIWGDGVNVAARLEALAEPGGICVSGRVQEDVHGTLEIAFDDIGEQQLKNIARPVRVYRVRLKGAAKAMPSLHQPTKPSIVVLPFNNMSGDPEQEYFADGMVEEITTALSRTRWLLVIARNSSFTYKGRAVDVKQVGRELGVRYVLEGACARPRIGCVSRRSSSTRQTEPTSGQIASMGRWRISLSCKTRSPQASWERSLLDWNKPRSSVRNASRLRALMHTTIICEGLRAFIPGRKRATTKRCGYSRKPLNSTLILPRPMAWPRGVTSGAREVVG